MIISGLGWRDGGIGYHNSDATWHMPLTVTAYDETPISDHLFLPIVTLGEESGKGIPWGATIPDNKGNYYYTSFSPAGYFAAYLFYIAWFDFMKLAIICKYGFWFSDCPCQKFEKLT